MSEIIKICPEHGNLTEDKIRREKNGSFVKIVCLECRRMKDILRKRKISREQYDDLRIKQQKKCAICFKEESLIGRSGEFSALALDHCHKCEHHNRELLCSACNKAIGKCFDNTEILQSAINYLKSHEHAI
jgi:hypothetical protein